MKRLRIVRRITRVHRRCRVPVRGARPEMLLRYALWSFISGVAGILAIIKATTLDSSPLLISSFGASAVLLFGATKSQPRILVGGHLVSTTVAVVIVALLGPHHSPWQWESGCRSL